MKINNILRNSLLFLLVIPFSCSTEVTIDSLKSQVESELAQEQGTFGIAFMDLQDGETLLINPDTVFHAASTMKTPVLIEIYKKAAGGALSLVDSVLIKNEFYSIVDSSTYSLSIGDDSEEALYSQIGSKRTIAQLAYDMIIVSSNLATNLLIELVDAKQVTQTMRSFGANKIEVLRGVEDIKAFELGLSNSTTPRDLMIIFEKLGKGEAISPLASEAMLKILFDQKFNSIIPAQLPEGVRVAHKTGSITGVRHDSGIVYLPNGKKYVLITLSKGLEKPEQGIKKMAAVSKMIYDYVEAKEYQ